VTLLSVTSPSILSNVYILCSFCIYSKLSIEIRRFASFDSLFLVRLIYVVVICLCISFQIIATAYRDQHKNDKISVASWLPRPVLRIKTAKNSFFKTTNFVDSILALRPLDADGLGLTDSDFEPAYRLASTRFEGHLQEYFLVLTDSSAHANKLPDRSGQPGGAGAASRGAAPGPGVSRQALSFGGPCSKRVNEEMELDDTASVASSTKMARLRANLQKQNISDSA